MLLSTSLFLACRYLIPKRQFISYLIPFLAILGPILGVAILIVVISVMGGFSHNIREKIFGLQAHITCYSKSQPTIVNSEILVQRLREQRIAATPVVTGPVFVQTEKTLLPKIIRGILPETEETVSDISRSIIHGRYSIHEDEVIIGDKLACELGKSIGDKLIIHRTGELMKSVVVTEDGEVQVRGIDTAYLPEEVRIAGIFFMGMYDYDHQFIITHIDKARDIFAMELGTARSIQIKVQDPFNLKPVLDILQQDKTVQDLKPVTWQEANHSFFSALAIEKKLQFFILIFIVIVSAFSIAATLITMVIQKTEEIGILKALGASPMTILTVFLFQGSIVGCIGIGFGTILGLAIVYFRNKIANSLESIIGIEIFPAALYKLDQIPALVQISDILWIDIMTLFICVMGAIIPAIYAATLTPTRAFQGDS